MSDYILNMLPVNEEEKIEFEAIAPDAVHVYTGRRDVTPEQLAQATVILGWPRPKDMKHAVNLKWFQTLFAGTDEYKGMIGETAIVTSSAGANKRSVAEHMLANVLSLCRKLPVYRDHQLAHVWSDEGKMKTLLDSTVLVVGTGNIGSTFAGFCRGLGAHTIGLKRTVTGPIEGFDRVYSIQRLDKLLPQADVVALVMPHTPETEGMMDGRRIALMKEDAILISSGRGSVLDQDALVQAMGAGKLWGAAMDVTMPEPLPEDSPLWDIPNLIITPHVAGGIRLEITRKTSIELAMDNLKNYLSGRTMKNLVRR